MCASLHVDCFVVGEQNSSFPRLPLAQKAISLIKGGVTRDSESWLAEVAYTKHPIGRVDFYKSVVHVDSFIYSDAGGAVAGGDRGVYGQSVKAGGIRPYL